MESAAWQVACAARSRGTIYRRDFDGTEREAPQRPAQTEAEMAAEVQKINRLWPAKK